jgi:hypothetical protein
LPNVKWSPSGGLERSVSPSPHGTDGPQQDEIMVALVEQLLRNKSQSVTLEFEDGEVVDAILLDVDPSEHEDITFDVIQVRHTVREKPYDKKNVYVAPINSIKSVRALS